MKEQEIKAVNEIADVLIDNKGKMLIEVAIALYNAGYRKKSEVIDEFVEMLLDKYDIWTDNDVLEYNYVSKIARRVAEEMKGGAE